jgi:hemerythrin-like domain-containing protein
MITYKELHEQIHKITEISNVFLYLIEERSMCDTQITCDLFFDYVGRVRKHLEVQDNYLYSAILTNGDDESRKIAENFMSGSKEIRRIFQQYMKKWANGGNKGHHLVIGNYDEFRRETQEVFTLVLKRIEDEIERLYPLVRGISGDVQQVA